MDIVTYALCKKLVSSVAGGISGYEVDGLTLKITTSDGKVLEMTFPEPKDGISINDVKINESNHLICTMSDGNEIDAGLIKTIQGPKGDPFKYEDFTPEQLEALKGPAGKDGEDGYTPQKGIDYFTEEDISEVIGDMHLDEYAKKKEIEETYVEKTIINEDGTKALIFNETDGGGAKFEGTEINSFVGVNDGSDNIDAMMYAIDKVTKQGSRIIGNKNGMYYTKGNNKTITGNDEIVTKKDLELTIIE